jgi:hypothetical protein
VAEYRTTAGAFVQDACGLWHYRWMSSAIGWIGDALADALAGRPSGACWFWWNGTFAPMHLGDSPGALHARWNALRDGYQRNPNATLAALHEIYLDALSHGEAARG